MSLRSFIVPDTHISWPSFLFPSAEQHSGKPKITKKDLLQIEDKLNQSESDSSSSDESSSSSTTSEIFPLENTSYILNCFTKVAHVAKFLNENPHPSPACGRDLGLSVEMLQVVDSVPADSDLCQHKACSMDR